MNPSPFTIVHYDHAGAALGEVAPIDLEFAIYLGRVGYCNYGINFDYPLARRSNCEPYRTDYGLFYGGSTGVKLQGGMHTDIGIQEIEDRGLKVSGKDWLHYLERRWYPFDPANPAGYIADPAADVFTTVETILNAAIALPNSLPITTGVSAPSGIQTGTFKIDTGDTTMLLNIFETLSQNKPGFDFELDVNRVWRMYAPKKNSTDALVNLVENPSFETNLAGAIASTNAPILTRIADPFIDTQALEVKAISANDAYVAFLKIDGSHFPVRVGLPYSFSAHVKRTVGSWTTVAFLIQWYDAAGAFISGSQVNSTPMDSYIRRSSIDVAPTGAVTAQCLIALAGSVAIGDKMVIDAIQFEQAGASTDYIDGSMRNAYWESTAHASRSYRKTSELTFELGVNIEEMDYTNHGPSGTHTMGTGIGSSTKLAAVVDSPAAAYFRRLDAVTDFGEKVADPAVLAVMAQAQSDRDVAPITEITFKYIPDENVNFWEKCKIGNTHPIHAVTEWETLDTELRVVGLQGSQNDEGDVEVAITFDDPSISL